MYSLANEGQLPFEESDVTPKEAMVKRFEGETVPAPKNGSEKLKSVIVIACQPDAKNRWKNAGNLKNALNAINTELKEDEEAKENVQKVLLYVLDGILRIVHPFMPFITEEIWQALPHDGESLMIARYPEYSDALSFPQEEADFEMVMEAIKAVRARRSDMNVPPSKKAHLYIVTDSPAAFEAGESYICKLAYAESIAVSDKEPEDASGMVSVVTDHARMFMPMAELVDLEKERERLKKEIEKAEKQLQSQIGKLANENFVSRAPEHVVNMEREKKDKLEALIENLNKSLSGLG